MNAGDSSNQLMSEINVTPFVDVMLVLLIIFMVTAPMMTQGEKVSLPETTSEPLKLDEKQLVITIDKKKQLYINDFKVSSSFFKEKLLKIMESRQNKEVYLKADKDIVYGYVVKIMAEIKASGINKIGMLTVPDVKNK